MSGTSNKEGVFFNVLTPFDFVERVLNQSQHFTGYDFIKVVFTLRSCRGQRSNSTLAKDFQDMIFFHIFFYRTALKGYWDNAFIHGVWMGRWAEGKLVRAISQKL